MKQAEPRWKQGLPAHLGVHMGVHMDSSNMKANINNDLSPQCGSCCSTHTAWGTPVRCQEIKSGQRPPSPTQSFVLRDNEIKPLTVRKYFRR